MSGALSERVVHVVAVALAFVVLGATSWVVNAYSLSWAVFGVASVVFNVLVFGGAHLYLASRGEPGSVPVDARWRFLAFLGVVAVATLLAIAFGGVVESTVGVDVRGVGVAFVAVAVVAYLFVEGRAAYRDALRDE